MIGEAAIVSHWIAAAAFFVLAVVLLLGRRGAPPRWLAAASGITALWAAALAYGAETGAFFALTLSLGESIRSGAWILFLAALMRISWHGETRNPSTRAVTVLLGIVFLQIAFDAAVAAGAGLSPSLQFASDMARVAVAIGGLVLTHNLYVSSAPANRWSLNILCIALAGLFAYDLNLFTLMMLDPVLAAGFFDARGIANAVLVPFFLVAAVRNRTLALQLSRQAALQTFALGAIGVYLLGMSLAAYLLGLLGGDWGRLFQIVLVFAAVLTGVTLLFSGRVRAWLRVMINKHFFAYKYDYREEWLRFLRTVGRSGPGYGSLEERVIEGVAGIVDSPGGALFLHEGGRRFEPEARWNFRAFDMAGFRMDESVWRSMNAESRIVERGGPLSGALPQEIAGNPRVWLLVPLGHVDELVAIIVLEVPRVTRVLDWEDYDILRTVGRQGASYIAEQSALASLEESRKFEEFNRRFAFIMHDIKNLVSQLSLLARNAERHAENPEFRKDMVATLKGSVGKMNELLVRLGQEAKADSVSGRFDLRALVAEVVAEKTRQNPNVQLDSDEYPLEISGDAGRLEQAVGHLVQNAIDASAPEAPIHVRLRNEAGAAKLIIEDRGCGMSASFVRDELFKPFRSTKEAGYGVGAYEAREIVRSAGGRLEVNSTPGEGSVFVVHLPVTAVRSEALQRESAL